MEVRLSIRMFCFIISLSAESPVALGIGDLRSVRDRKSGSGRSGSGQIVKYLFFPSIFSDSTALLASRVVLDYILVLLRARLAA